MLWTEFHEDTVVFRTRTPESDAGGSTTYRPSAGTSLSCKVDAKTVSRIDDMGTIVTATTYTLYFAAEPTDTSVGARAVDARCRVEDTFAWGDKTLVATGKALSLSALGETQYKVECLERV